MDFWQYEKEAMSKGYAAVCGCDEAGAGPLAGPVYAAAVILPFGENIPGLDDSKKLTEKKRETLFPMIQDLALAWSIAWIEAKEIDETDILSARMRAMQLAMDGLERKPDFALIDGNRDKGRHHHPPPLSGQRRQPVRLYRGGLHSRQGEPGPVYGEDGRAISQLSL